MAVEKLNNFRKSMFEMMADIPQSVMERIDAQISVIISKYLWPDEIKRYSSVKTSAIHKMQETKTPFLKQNGFNNLEFINQQIEWNASFEALSFVKADEVALQICRNIAETAYPALFAAMLPSPESLARCDDPFTAFSEWFLMYMKANKQERLFDFNLVEKNNTVFHFRCSFCAWYAIHNELGNPKACESICYADLAFFPNYCKAFNVTFDRPYALGWGDTCCEFSFIRGFVKQRSISVQ